ncbi:hypothetical protein [Peribacillus sp. NPDC096540]
MYACGEEWCDRVHRAVVPQLLLIVSGEDKVRGEGDKWEVVQIGDATS